ncbi:uncharacterized protein METZ01_LOCUS107115, partial [marine metagenome]
IADAKAVREAALENAKMALEEAFTPRLKSMLAKKIQSEIEEDEVTEDSESDKDAEPVEESDDEQEVEEGMYEDDEDPSDEDSEEEMGDEEEPAPEEDPEESMGYNEEDIIEIDGVKYAPIVSEEGEEEEGEEGEEEAPEGEEDDEDMGEDLDLEAVLRELEAELSEDDEADPSEESVDESDESEESDEAVEEADEAKEDKETVDESEKDEETVDESEEAEETVDEADESNESEEITEEEEIDLEEVLRALQEEDEEDTTTEDMEKLQSELKEHRDVVKYLRSKLNEVNLLNAKLLFTNKLFRSYGLSNEQKMKVVETFDRAKSLREVKLVYSTMAESFGSQSTRAEIVKESKKGSASKPVASTKSGKQEKEIISESDSMKQRFQKLANIL